MLHIQLYRSPLAAKNATNARTTSTIVKTSADNAPGAFWYGESAIAPPGVPPSSACIEQQSRSRDSRMAADSQSRTCKGFNCLASDDLRVKLAA
jgi:hypothetical protein